MANDFGNLPQELQIHILSNLDGFSLIRCAMTCKSIHELLKSSLLLLYHVQLHLDGFIDTTTSISYPDLIESLVKRRPVWLSLERKELQILHTQQDCRSYELAGGAFANMSQEGLEIAWLPTSDIVKGRTLHRSSIGFSVRDFTMDPTQDLIVFLQDDMTSPTLMTDTRTVLVHVRTISTDTKHPLAQQSLLRFTVIPEHIHRTAINSTTLQITRNTLALYFRNVEHEARVLIWDWTTSELILDTSVSFDPSLTSLRYNFGLLDSLYFFVICPSNFGSIRLYKLVQSHAGTSPAIHLATLHLPPTSPGASILKFFSHAGPIEANPLPHTLFMINDDDRLHVFTVVYKQVVDGNLLHISPINLFLHQRVLLKYALHALTNKTPLDILWGEWGPPNTMFICPRIPYESHWIRYVHGQRCVFPGGVIGDDSHMSDPSLYVEVLDFSLAATLSAKGVLSMPPSIPKGKLGTLLPSGTIRTRDCPFFLDDVETHLPCVISTLNLKEAKEAYMIHADGIVGVNIRNDGHFLLHIYTV